MTPYTTKCHRCSFEFAVEHKSPAWRLDGFCSINCKNFGWISTEDMNDGLQEINDGWNQTEYLTEGWDDYTQESVESKIDLDEIQSQHARLTFKNFGWELGPERCLQPLAGVTEEAGELAHAILKLTQRIRTDEPHYKEGQDAVGDIVMYLLDICTRMGWSFNDCVDLAWSTIEKRDWTKEREEMNA